MKVTWLCLAAYNKFSWAYDLADNGRFLNMAFLTYRMILFALYTLVLGQVNSQIPVGMDSGECKLTSI